MPAELPFHPRFQCYVNFLEYDFLARRGRLLMGEISCTDMRGCIAVFEAIDLNVTEIETHRAGQCDTIYRKIDGKWTALTGT